MIEAADRGVRVRLLGDDMALPDGYYKGEDDLENLDARLGWRSDHWDIAIWGNNLTDDVYTLGYSENTFTGSIFPALGLTQRDTYDVWLSEPRSYGLTARYIF